MRFSHCAVPDGYAPPAGKRAHGDLVAPSSAILPQHVCTNSGALDENAPPLSSKLDVAVDGSSTFSRCASA